MTKQKYIMWHIDGERKVRFGDETITLRWHPGREEQFLSMIARWMAEDGTLGPPTEDLTVLKDGDDIIIRVE